jgi:O-acetyl-ADP-ribose deacetylase (regulator of RNase III)
MIKVILGDITTLKVDAIVNAANKTLLGGGGVDGAIHRAAGPELLAECRTLHGCEIGNSKITDAYNLPCKKVIHTVGPIWLSGKFHEQEKLASCYHTAIELAKEYELKSIAFPCISTGVYRFPKVEAAKIALNTLNEEISNGFIGDITICCFDAESKSIYDSLF